MKIYLVVSESFDDFVIRNVRAFTDKETAEIFAVMAEDEALAVSEHNLAIRLDAEFEFPFTGIFKNPRRPWEFVNEDNKERYLQILRDRQDYKDEHHKTNKYDKNTYDGATYHVDELELDGDIP